jgi:hypothetical protein
MANPLLQKARQRKMIYFGAIVVLFTLSLIHREFYVKAQATRLQLRETARGEVELTSSAVRLLMTGSRGLAVTMLWYTAMEKQKRNEWNELELIVKSITKLQPYFIIPWLYQSWNLSFNVAVEFDRPRDKYYYISRGLELLAEGERRNSGMGDQGAAGDPDRIVIPGNPELRYEMGRIYQLKIGNSDERLTMRSLLEMSCIDPVERNPDRFWATNEKGEKVVDPKELAQFCQKYPRLVRRLHEQLEYPDPQRIVQFLQDHQNIPNRFKPIEKSKQVNIQKSDLKDPLDQFPILPPKEGAWPNPLSRDLTDETIDVFLICRTWYEYAQKPLPPPDPNPGLNVPDYDKLRYRMPKGMMVQLFRQYPALAQVFIAETLESEGFFDSDGWDMSAAFKKWSNRRDLNPEDYTYGTDSKYHSRLAWESGYKRYEKFGRENGIYIPPAEMKALNESAELFLKQIKSDQNPPAPPELREGKLWDSYKAYQKLKQSEFFRNLCNFDAFLYQAEGESDPIAVAMRKSLFFAERKRRRDTPSELTMELYQEVWDLYLHVCFKHPRFAQVASMQEDLYEIHIRSLGLAHALNREIFKAPVLFAAKIGYWPIPNLQECIIQGTFVSTRNKDELVIEKKGEQQEMLKIFPIRKRYGSLDLVQYYNGPAANELKETLFAASRLASYAAPPMGVAPAIALPSGQKYFLLTRRTPFLEENVPEHWAPLISVNTRNLVSERLGMNR